MKDSKEYEVGRGKPPREHQFKKGQCANPKGRGYKKGPGAAEVFVRVHAEKIGGAGKSPGMSRIQATIRQLSTAALTGNLNAMESLIDWHNVSEKMGDFRGTGIKYVSAERDRILKLVELGKRLNGRTRRRRKRT